MVMMQRQASRWKAGSTLSIIPADLSQVDLKDKWRNLCKTDPTLEDVGKQNGNQAGPHGTPAALRLPPDEQVDENAPPGVEGAQSPRVSAALLGLCLLPGNLVTDGVGCNTWRCRCQEAPSCLRKLVLL